MATPGAGTVLWILVTLTTCLSSLLYLTGSDITCPVACVTGLIVLVSSLLLWRLRQRDDGTGRRVCVLVLGDIGRSPRMQYHALSLKVKGVRVGPKILTYVTKVIVQFLQLLHVLLRMELQSHILMQNPPGLPSMAVAWLVCVLRGSRFIIDWHNYGYTIMALSHGQRHPVVRLAKWYEHLFGPLATHNLCVTKAMKDDLQKNWGIKATTLYDRPASIFREAPLTLQHQLFMRLAKTYPEFQYSGSQDVKVERTMFSVRNLADDRVTLRAERPVLLISSTSWTGRRKRWFLLSFCINAPVKVETVTDCKGPQKEHYRKLIDCLHLEHVKICTPWLEAEDYPVLLGSADLGVCLHKSSSGLDLPMKVVDMFGCCLPVCAIQFSCLQELVKHEENGLIFRDSQELAEQLKALLSQFPNSDGTLGLFRRNLRTNRGERWSDNWDQNVLPLITAP
uniref:Glycosyltransferase subfamily 4-like N-terminal domain-containing protein n=1 Tax=Anabas testudineus TaxID=64144 RepID=A0A7N6BK34_ANATE